MSVVNLSGGGGKLAVKNKTPNPIQVTAEQLLREAVERQQKEVKAPRQRVMDEDELADYRVRKRKEYEDALRRQRHNLGIWIRYAEWEGAQRDFRRARSVYERALVVDFSNIGLWSKYIEMETKNKFVNSARNLYDRVTQLLPRVDHFWIKYTYMEELLGNYAGARAIFERWMQWEPEEKAWLLYVRFEERCEEVDRARCVFERLLSCRPCQSTFLKYSKFEEKHYNIIKARASFEKAIEVLPEEYLDEKFFIKFAQFEERQKEFERVKSVFEQALLRFPKEKCKELEMKYVAFQKQRGDRETLETVVIQKRRIYYEEKLRKSPKDYDTWFDLIRLEELYPDIDRLRDTYERAVAQLPPVLQKKYWKRYIYLWLNYAFFEEMIAKDVERTRNIYDKVIEILPHKQFSFCKIWIQYADFEIRQLQLDCVRKIYGRALGEYGKDKIFLAYAALELSLGNIERCRTIHAKFIEKHPTSTKAWISFIDFEVNLEEYTRGKALCEIAIDLNTVTLPEMIWKKYIDIEANQGEHQRVRDLYERLLKISQHYKVFKAYSSFEFSVCHNIIRAREILGRGIQHCKETKKNEERKFLIEHLISLEKQHGDAIELQKAIAMKPKAIRIRKTIKEDNGLIQGYEEAIEYLFKDDLSQSANLEIIEKAKAWKKQQQQQQQQQEIISSSA